jgi:hypothetical protein
MKSRQALVFGNGRLALHEHPRYPWGAEQIAYVTVDGDDLISGAHCMIAHSEAGFAVVDLGSVNGTHVIPASLGVPQRPDDIVRGWAMLRGVRVRHGHPRLLSIRDRVMIGRTVLPWVPK